MTDKELRKLSRLELLELLLEASKENEKLKEKIEELKIENKTAQNIENLSVATHQIEEALRYANSLTDTLKCTSSDGYTKTKNHNPESNPLQDASPVSDRDIYWRLMGFYSKNPEALNMLPENIRSSVINRINEILERLNKK